MLRGRGRPEADALIEQVAAEGAAVPALWPLELANGLVICERRGRISQAESATFVGRGQVSSVGVRSCVVHHPEDLPGGEPPG